MSIRDFQNRHDTWQGFLDTLSSHELWQLDQLLARCRKAGA